MISVGDKQMEFESARRVRRGFGFGFEMKMGDVGCRRAMRDDSDVEPDSEPDVDDEDEGDQEE